MKLGDELCRFIRSNSPGQDSTRIPRTILGVFSRRGVKDRRNGGESRLGRWNSRNAEGMVGCEEASSLNSLPIPEIVAPECAIFLPPPLLSSPLSV